MHPKNLLNIIAKIVLNYLFLEKMIFYFSKFYLVIVNNKITYIIKMSSQTVEISVSEYKDILKNRIHKMIKDDLTIGRTDNDLEPFDDIKINDFIRENSDKIDIVISEMIEVYTDDNELELLKNPENDWINEFMYNHIDTGLNTDNE